MRCSLLAIIGFLFLQTAFAQTRVYPEFFSQRLTYLNNNITQAKSDSDKIVALGELAEYYYIYKLEKEGDSILQQQLTIAELLPNKNLTLSVLFGNAIMNITPWTPSEVFDKTIRLLQTGLNYARELNRKDFVALAYLRIAYVLRKRGQNDKAMENATKAFSVLENVKADSIRTVLNLELGDIYLERKDAVQAFQNYSNAYDIAYNIKNIPLQSQCYHRFFTLYQYTLKNAEMAKDNLRKSLDLNKAKHNLEGILADYKDFARSSDNPLYIDSLLKYTDLLQNEKFNTAASYRISGKQLMLAYYMVVKANSQQALNYFYNNADLKFFMLNSGAPIYYLNLGNIYFYSNQFDSALHYYKLGEPEVVKAFEKGTKASIQKNIAKCYQRLNEPQNAIDYYQKSLAYNNADMEVLFNLSNLYAQVSDFEKAYTYSNKYSFYRDSIQKLNNQRELDLLEIDRENKQHQKEMEEEEATRLRRHNLQYMAITLAIAFLFLVLIFTGMFPVSKVAIRMLNFLSFICLFEFIILLIDNWLHHLTHGEPLQVWLAKIVIIAMLLPLHHWLEHIAIHFISSHKLVKLRQRFSLKRLWHPSKKAVSKIEKELEDSTLV